MKLHFLGANRQVTGSRYCLEAAGRWILIDCGLVQEREFLSRNWDPCPIPADKIDTLLLTHIHIDHSGLIPRFVREGFDGTIYATHPSLALAGIMLHDTARIQMEDAAYKRRRHEKEGRRGKHPEIPLYEDTDVDSSLRRFHGVEYRVPLKLSEEITVTFHDAGHILGSAMLEIELREQGTPTRLIFSGDIGQWNKPLMHDPALLTRADYVVMESTYGTREHESPVDIESELAEIINQTVEQGGNVVIPTFAVERAQELLYYISRLVHQNRIPDVPIFLDSPMAVDVMEVFKQFAEDFDEETRQLLKTKQHPFRFPGLRLVRRREESREINSLKTSCIIMSASGMCTAGRIKHHLRHNIGGKENTILFVGYQAQGTLGRQILDGNPHVRIHGIMYPVRARVAQIFGFSAHADHTGLLHWLKQFTPPPKEVFLTHGGESVSLALAEEIRQQWGWNVTVPEYLQQVMLK